MRPKPAVPQGGRRPDRLPPIDSLHAAGIFGCSGAVDCGEGAADRAEWVSRRARSPARLAQGYTLAAKSDLRFAEEVWRIAIRELALRPPLSVPQFLSDGYAVPKLQLLRDLVAAVRARSERALQPWASRQGANGVHTRRVRPRPPTSQPEAPPQSDRFQPRARALRGWSTGVEAAAAAAAAAWPATRSAAPLLRESKARRSTSAHRAAGTVVPPALVSTSASASVSPSSGPASASPASIYRYASFGPPPRTAHQHPASKASLPVREPQPSAGSQDSDALEHGAGVAPLHEHTCSRRHHQLQSSLETCVCHIQEMTSVCAAWTGSRPPRRLAALQ